MARGWSLAIMEPTKMAHSSYTDEAPREIARYSKYDLLYTFCYMNRLRVGIIGGGIGGLTLAGALRKFGIASHIFERAPVFGEIGAGIQMTPNGVKVLRALGLWQALHDVSFRPEC